MCVTRRWRRLSHDPPMTVSLFSAALAAWRATNGIPQPASPPLDAVVKLSIRTVEGARTADSLGSEREGTGIVYITF